MQLYLRLTAKGVSYEMNLSASVIFESMINGEDIQSITGKFKNIFDGFNTDELEREMTKTIEDLERLGLIKVDE